MCSEKMSVLSRTTPRLRTLDEKVKDGKVFARRAKSSLRSCCRVPNQISWFLAAIFPYSRVIVGMPDSHVQRICPGLLHVSGRRCTTWKTVSMQSFFTDDNCCFAHDLSRTRGRLKRDEIVSFDIVIDKSRLVNKTFLDKCFILLLSSLFEVPH